MVDCCFTFIIMNIDNSKVKFGSIKILTLSEMAKN